MTGAHALGVLALVRRHFFPDFNPWIDHLRDPRRPDLCTYTLRHLLWSGLLMLLGGGGSRLQHVSDTLDAGFLRALLALCGTGEGTAAHPGTLNHLMMHLASPQLLLLNVLMVRRLLRTRCLERFRFGAEWLVAVDGVEIRTYARQHCAGCLHRRLSNGKVQYFHSILEAKLILGNGMVVSLCSVPLLNEPHGYSKQDCELKAFERLADRLRQLFPKLRMCLLMDGMFGCEPVFRRCREMGWSHITVFKEGRAPTRWKQALEECDRHPGNRKTVARKDGTVQQFAWATGLRHGAETVHAVRCAETDPQGKTTHWAWISDHRPDRHNVDILANKGGRLRWKIENEGFNVQKNGGIRLKHDYGSQGNAWYNYYLLAQIAHLLLQLCWLGDAIRTVTGAACATMATAFGTVRNFAERLRREVCAGTGPPPGGRIAAAAIQIRFSSA